MIVGRTGAAGGFPQDKRSVDAIKSEAIDNRIDVMMGPSLPRIFLLPY
jgi:hypothetical protein